MTAERGRETFGVLGGSFDPVHNGHLHVARAAGRALALRRVLFVPCAIPPHKPDARLAAAEHRLRMVELAIAGDPLLAVDTLELDRGGPSYTIDTIRALRSREAGTPVFVIGTDSLLELTTWKDYRRLLDECDLVVVRRAADRPGEARLDEEIAARVVEIPPHRSSDGAALPVPGGRGRIFRVSGAPMRVSASQVRARARRGEPLARLVPAAVARYIRDEGLYRREETC